MLIPVLQLNTEAFSILFPEQSNTFVNFFYARFDIHALTENEEILRDGQYSGGKTVAKVMRTIQYTFAYGYLSICISWQA